MLRRPTAIKVMRPERVGKHDLARFEREVQLTSQLSHPNTITIYDYGRTPAGALYYVMEYLEGVNLEQLVTEDGAQPSSRVIYILKQICLSLGEAHSVGLIHRDIKPANVFISERGGEFDFVKVLDFGLVKELTALDDSGSTQTMAIAGTPLFMAPEALDSRTPASIRADIYAVGAVGYYLLTGTPVFRGATVLDLVRSHLNEEVEPPSLRLGRPISASLETVVLSCLAKRPEDRPQSSDVLHDRLVACVDVSPWTRDDSKTWWRRRTLRRESTTSARPDVIDVDFTGRTTLFRQGEKYEAGSRPLEKG
jgi:serine/threonine protein kinase